MCVVNSYFRLDGFLPVCCSTNELTNRKTEEDGDMSAYVFACLKAVSPRRGLQLTGNLVQRSSKLEVL